MSRLLAGAHRYALTAMFAFTGLSHFLPRTRPRLSLLSRIILCNV
jgi:hypothetical protein